MVLTFGDLLKQSRKRAGMTQDDLAAATGYSRALIGALECNRRLPDIEAVIQSYLPALALQNEPRLAAQLVELAAAARGERPPPRLPLTHERRIAITREVEEVVHDLPFPPTALLGRDTEINHLCNRLLGHTGRLLTLLGPPGVGKTRLAQAVGAAMQSCYKDGACFVPLAAVSNPALVASSLLTALQVRDDSSKPPQSRLIAYLRHKEMLLLLDNFEQIIAAAPLVAELLAECGGLRLLVTSRERLHLRAEQRYRVLPLDLAPAIQLFVQRAQAVEADFRLTAHNQPTLAAICQRLDCLPLALELCAAQVDLLSPAQLLAQLQSHRLDLLVEGATDLPPHQRTLRAAIQRSYDLLNAEERTLFRRLGVFVGGFDLEAVEAVESERREAGDFGVQFGKLTAPEPVEGQSLFSCLHSLVGKSLVRAETLPNGEQRFLLLETIREFALEQLRAHDEEALLRQRHYAAYLQRFRTGDSHLRGGEAAIWVARLEPDQDNLRAALQWTLDEARYADAAWLMVAVHYLWFLRGARYEGAKWLEQLLPHRQTLATDLHLATLITFYVTAFAVEEFPPVNRYTGEVKELLEVCSDKLLQAAAYYWLGWSATEVAQTVALVERCITLAQAASEAPGLGAEFGAMTDHTFVLTNALLLYADNLIDQGEVARAAPVAAESLAIFRRRGDSFGIAQCLGTLGRLALLQGDLTQAQRLFHEVMTIATTYSLPMTQCEWQPLLGVVTLYRGDALEARQLLDDSLRVCIELKSKFFLARVYTYLAELALWEGEVTQAAHWLAQSVDYQADQHRITTTELQRLWIAARLATAQQQYPRAATLFGLANQAHSQIHHAIVGPMRDLADAALATVRAALEPAVFAEAFATGQRMTLVEAFATILAPSSLASASLERVQIAEPMV